MVRAQPDLPPIVVHVEDVHKTYGTGTISTPVLNGVNLTVHRGECVYLAGPSGSGKTTLLSILGCILSADRGKVQILDQDVLALDPQGRVAMRLHRIGFVFQRFHLIRGLTALGNVCVPLTLRGISRRGASQRAAALLEAVGLAGKENFHPKNLSAGQCQRVALARALVGDPELILADEPTASLDANNGREAMELLRRLAAEQGRTLIVVTHDQRIFRYADRIFWLENGRVAETRESGSSPSSPESGSP